MLRERLGRYRIPADRSQRGQGDRVRFRAPVLPPAEVLLQVTITDERGGMVRAKGEARVDGAKAVTCQLTGTRVELPRAEA